MKTDIHVHVHLLSYVAEFLLEWETFQTNAVEEIKTHFKINNYFSKIVPIMW